MLSRFFIKCYEQGIMPKHICHKNTQKKLQAMETKSFRIFCKTNYLKHTCMKLFFFVFVWVTGDALKT